MPFPEDPLAPRTISRRRALTLLASIPPALVATACLGSDDTPATIVVDGTEVGVTPFVGAYEAGDHEVEVRLHGESESRDVVLEPDGDAVEVSVTLSDANDGLGVFGIGCCW